jgi:multimeric flavodoxin WrbA
MAGENTHPQVRTGQAEGPLSRAEFERRFRARFTDPAFSDKSSAVEELLGIAWEGYCEARKSPRTRKAGAGFADPDYDISIDWLDARDAIQRARTQHDDPSRRDRVLLICGAARNDKSCPGEMSKTYRLVQMAKSVFENAKVEVDLLDLSILTSEYGKIIYPCKACVSSAMPLCHWPCSCYPNHGLGQVTDWMNELYPRWVAAHGVMIVTPVYWYQAPSVLKLMMDRLVCADGGNPDPTSTHGKKVAEAKEIELKGWDYPRHLAGRSFAVLVHGDSAGTENLRRTLSDWLNDMHLVQAGADSCLDRYIDYFGAYATSHDALDRDVALHREVRNAARALVSHVAARRQGRQSILAERFDDPRPK